MSNELFSVHPAKLLLRATVPFWFGVLLLLVVTGITYKGWHRVQSRVLQADKSCFSATSVHVTETPPWVPETIVNDVISAFTIGRAPQDTLIDRELLRELATAFRAYHWVESVDRVRASFPATVTLDLTYRTPICMVLLPKDEENPDKEVAHAVDRHGVYLPSDYFARNPNVANLYLKVLGVKSTPTGNLGDKWGDVVVEQAAALADHLAHDNSVLNIASIRVETTGTNQYNTKHLFYLTTSRDTEIIWGEMPLAENDIRKERLMQLVHQYGSLDKAPLNASDVIDVRKNVAISTQ
jgi:hypothetical protein